MDGQATSIVALTGMIISIATTVIAVVNHKRIRSKCCGKDVSASLDIENTSPVIIPQKV